MLALFQGRMVGCVGATYYPNRNIKAIQPSEPVVVETTVGPLKVSGSLYFFPNGVLKFAWFPDQTIIDTPAGDLDIDYVSFYEDGRIHDVITKDGRELSF